jgi:predicted RNA-binding protein YlqC (UPF0109 family)
MKTLSLVVKELITEYIEFPDELSVEEEDGESTILLRVKARREDTAKIIGKEGKNVEALRRIVNIIASNRKVRVNLHIVS